LLIKLNELVLIVPLKPVTEDQELPPSAEYQNAELSKNTICPDGAWYDTFVFSETLEIVPKVVQEVPSVDEYVVNVLPLVEDELVKDSKIINLFNVGCHIAPLTALLPLGKLELDPVKPV
jgi:hypothetical protein